MGISVIGICSTCTNHGFRFHEPESSTCSCSPRQPPASTKRLAALEAVVARHRGPGQIARRDGPAVERRHDADAVRRRPWNTSSSSGRMPMLRGVGRGDDREERRVDAVGARGEDRQLPALLAAAARGSARASWKSSQATSRPRMRSDGMARAVVGDHQRDLARAGRSTSGTFCTLYLPPPEAEVPARRQQLAPGSRPRRSARRGARRPAAGPNCLITRPDSSSAMTQVPSSSTQHGRCRPAAPLATQSRCRSNHAKSSMTCLPSLAGARWCIGRLPASQPPGSRHGSARTVRGERDWNRVR